MGSLWAVTAKAGPWVGSKQDARHGAGAGSQVVGEGTGEWGGAASLAPSPQPPNARGTRRPALSPTSCQATQWASLEGWGRKVRRGAPSGLRAGVRLGQWLKPQTMEALSLPRVGIPTPQSSSPRDFLGTSQAYDPQEEAPGQKSPLTRHPSRGEIPGGCCLGNEREATGPHV